MADNWDDTQVGSATGGSDVLTASKYNALVTYVKNLVSLTFTTTHPEMDGTAAEGSATTAAKSDHVHPTDTSRGPTIHNLVDTTNHPVTGLTAGHFIKATSGTAYGFAAHGIDAAAVGALSTTTAAAAKRSIFLSCAGGWTSVTLPDNGINVFETATNKVNLRGTKFAAAAANMNHEFGLVMPKNYNGSTITAKPYFYTTGTAASNQTIIFGLQGIAYANGETLDTAYGTPQISTTTVASSIAGKMAVGAATSAITIAGTPAGEEWVQFRTFRQGDDTSTNDVILLGWLISYTTNNYSDE